MWCTNTLSVFIVDSHCSNANILIQTTVREQYSWPSSTVTGGREGWDCCLATNCPETAESRKHILADESQRTFHLPVSVRIDVSADRADVLAGVDFGVPTGSPENAAGVRTHLGPHIAEDVGYIEQSIVGDSLAEVDLEVDEAADGRAVLLEALSQRSIGKIELTLDLANTRVKP